MLGTAFDAEDAGPGHNRAPARLISGPLNAAVLETVVHQSHVTRAMRRLVPSTGLRDTAVAKIRQSTTAIGVREPIARCSRDDAPLTDCGEFG